TSNEYDTASRSSGFSPARSRHQRADISGSSQAAHGTGRLACLRRLKRSSSAAARTCPSSTTAAAESWKSALIPRVLLLRKLSRNRLAETPPRREIFRERK